jgi:hypothetical protein
MAEIKIAIIAYFIVIQLNNDVKFSLS